MEDWVVNWTGCSDIEALLQKDFLEQNSEALRAISTGDRVEQVSSTNAEERAKLKGKGIAAELRLSKDTEAAPTEKVLIMDAGRQQEEAELLTAQMESLREMKLKKQEEEAIKLAQTFQQGEGSSQPTEVEKDSTHTEAVPTEKDVPVTSFPSNLEDQVTKEVPVTSAPSMQKEQVTEGEPAP